MIGPSLLPSSGPFFEFVVVDRQNIVNLKLEEFTLRGRNTDTSNRKSPFLRFLREGDCSTNGNGQSSLVRMLGESQRCSIIKP